MTWPLFLRAADDVESSGRLTCDLYRLMIVRDIIQLFAYNELSRRTATCSYQNLSTNLRAFEQKVSPYAPHWHRLLLLASCFCAPLSKWLSVCIYVCACLQ